MFSFFLKSKIEAGTDIMDVTTSDKQVPRQRLFFSESETPQFLTHSFHEAKFLETAHFQTLKCAKTTARHNSKCKRIIVLVLSVGCVADLKKTKTLPENPNFGKPFQRIVSSETKSKEK